MPVTEARTDRATSLVFRPFTTLPSLAHQDTLGTDERRAWLAAMPEAIAGLLRQFRSQVLDLGSLGFSDRERYRVYRGQVFDLHDRLALQLLEWLRFWGVLTEEDLVDPDLLTLLAEK